MSSCRIVHFHKWLCVLVSVLFFFFVLLLLCSVFQEAGLAMNMKTLLEDTVIKLFLYHRLKRRLLMCST